MSGTPSGVYADDGALRDIAVHFAPEDARPALRMLGGGGAERELRLLDGCNFGPDRLPVLLGAGLGFALEKLLCVYDGPVAVVDKEADILDITGVEARFKHGNLLFIRNADPRKALALLTDWQVKNGGAPLLALANPFYLRLDRPYYDSLKRDLDASLKFDFWGKARKPRFRTGASPRLLLLTSRYFLMGELAGACERLNLPCRLLTLEDDCLARQDFIENLLKNVLEFEPDCILTLNHLGVDREGVLMELLERLNLPLASWFVDNPHLILHLYEKLASPLCAIFTWDADNVKSLNHMGFKHVFYLPLATDPRRFTLSVCGRTNWKSRVSFVGNSMIYKVGHRLKAGKFPASMLRGYRETAAAFGASNERSVRDFILGHSRELAADYENLPGNESRLAYETALTWEATRQYRLECVRRILPFNPLIAGDPGWRICLKDEAGKHSFRLHKELGYYDELPKFYPCSEINFNCTSKQMKGAVNQRIFDAPAAGAFVLTDWREQIENLFEPGKEIVFYKEIEEIEDLTRFYLDHPEARNNVALAARKRILAEHTWEHRLSTIMTHMAEVFGRS